MTVILRIAAVLKIASPASYLLTRVISRFTEPVSCSVHFKSGLVDTKRDSESDIVTEMDEVPE